MMLRERLLALVRPIEVGSEVVPGAVLARATVELGLRLSFAIDGGEELLHVELGPLEEGTRFAARSDRLAVSYRVNRARDGRLDALGKALCDAVAVAIAPNEAAFFDAVDASAGRGERIREVEVEALLEPAGMGDDRHYAASPYVGCLIGCRFCYAQSRTRSMRRLLRLADAPWGSYVDARMNAPAVLDAELARMEMRPIKVCPIVSDPYHAIEARLELTAACLDVFAKHPEWPVLLLTRSALARRDFARMARIPRLRFGVSLPTVDDETRAAFEPRAASVQERLALLRDARAHGMETFAIVQPVLAGPIDALADALAEHAGSVGIDVLRGTEGAAADFDAPRFRETATDAWQRAARAELCDRLARAGVPVWSGELPPT